MLIDMKVQEKVYRTELCIVCVVIKRKRDDPNSYLHKMFRMMVLGDFTEFLIK